MTGTLTAAACGGRELAGPAADPLSTLPGTYVLATVDGQRPPVAWLGTGAVRDTLVADTLRLSAGFDSSLFRVVVYRWFVDGGVTAGPGEATIRDRDGVWRVRDGRAFIWVLFNPDSVPISVPDTATIEFMRQGRRFVYRR
jgi:hypothetical protein